ncbi:Cysteine and histidine-rich domain-containing protein-like [Homarus americanus]|uniref:Cysteine and histidine-rich domain-containing protein-like n=1 Tax=Homarus americanus TaxID=6706 RepID=A0A8J5JLY0_HOMAM|nr:Cysteine and histidine-rich domain-containing protein-like [Homarus americanus]
MATVQCYNKGCGQKFKLEENTDDACEYHPGAPIFHDAYKGWSCCNKKSTDFTTFLNTKGCTKGRHNPDKPVEPQKPKIDQSTRDEVITVESSKQAPALPRPEFDSPLKRLPLTVSQSLKQALEKTEGQKDTENKTDGDEKNICGVKIGENCQNNGCKISYEGEHSNLDMCKYHPGIPIFHEGLKYWSCCRKKTTDFTEFLEQLGCSTGILSRGSCQFLCQETKKVAACRYDWHQTATHVYVAVYAKLSDPAVTFVEANPIRLNANIVFGEANVFTLDIELRGLIDIDQSSVSLAASKVEIKLRKAEPSSWRTLNIEREQMSENKTDDEKADEKAEEEGLEEMVDAVDLSDL